MGYGQGQEQGRQGQRAVGRRTLLGSAVAVAAAGVPGTALATTPATPGAPRAPRTSALWREFAESPYTHPQIPYVGKAGQRAGADRFPRHRVVADVRAYGAKGDGSVDDAPAINRALAAAGERGGGTVTIPPGTYRIDDMIRIAHSDVVLRGAGSGRTKLYATKNLTELIGPYGSRYGGDKSSWSWAGGVLL
ncbi:MULTISPECIES: glycoside hydrolase family 55 protein, partial [unclassified Streptomyces]|uniref:glycoside hydrolase family 55 protein n=1 Tax=unclassified Streptomyces TaxID=2593676 RepID=UPI00081D7D0D